MTSKASEWLRHFDVSSATTEIYLMKFVKGSKYSTSSTKVFFWDDLSAKMSDMTSDWLGYFSFSSAIAEENLT